MTKWQPIATAPQDGTIILTDLGTMQYIGRDKQQECRVGWWLCTTTDYVPDIRLEWLAPYEPTHWMPLPEPPAD